MGLAINPRPRTMERSLARLLEEVMFDDVNGVDLSHLRVCVVFVSWCHATLHKSAWC